MIESKEDLYFYMDADRVALRVCTEKQLHMDR